MSPSSPIDPAILRALSLSPSTTKIASHGGSGFTSTYRLTTPTSSFFVKTSPDGESARTMFEGEHTSLNAINAAVPSLCPRSLGWGPLENRNGSYFLATEFLELGGGLARTRGAGKSGGSGLTLAQKLAILHTTTAPHYDGYDTPQFGFPVITYCGDTPQSNNFSPSWPEFFAKDRLLTITERGEKRNGKDPELRKIIERTVAEVVPKLLGHGHLGGGEGIRPVVVHGDLWSGNRGRGRFVGREGDEAGVEEVIFDPSACYAHSEYELGIMNMFGGFGSSFFQEYHALVPKTEPAEEYDDRVALYESYHHLNHWTIFGGGYRSGAVSILKRLIQKYGEN